MCIRDRRERIECQNVTLIRGNHDGDWEDPDVSQIWEDVRDYLEIAPGYAKGHRLVMSHYPMLSWNGKARGSIMLHGHIHSRGAVSYTHLRVDRCRPVGYLYQHVFEEPVIGAASSVHGVAR